VHPFRHLIPVNTLTSASAHRGLLLRVGREDDLSERDSLLCCFDVGARRRVRRHVGERPSARKKFQTPPCASRIPLQFRITQWHVFFRNGRHVGFGKADKTLPKMSENLRRMPQGFA